MTKTSILDRRYVPMERDDSSHGAASLRLSDGWAPLRLFRFRRTTLTIELTMIRGKGNVPCPAPADAPSSRPEPLSPSIPLKRCHRLNINQAPLATGSGLR